MRPPLFFRFLLNFALNFPVLNVSRDINIIAYNVYIEREGFDSITDVKEVVSRSAAFAHNATQYNSKLPCGTK